MPLLGDDNCLHRLPTWHQSRVQGAEAQSSRHHTQGKSWDPGSHLPAAQPGSFRSCPPAQRCGQGPPCPDCHSSAGQAGLCQVLLHMEEEAGVAYTRRKVGPLPAAPWGHRGELTAAAVTVLGSRGHQGTRKDTVLGEPGGARRQTSPRCQLCPERPPARSGTLDSGRSPATPRPSNPAHSETTVTPTLETSRPRGQRR